MLSAACLFFPLLLLFKTFFIFKHINFMRSILSYSLCFHHIIYDGYFFVTFDLSLFVLLNWLVLLAPKFKFTVVLLVASIYIFKFKWITKLPCHISMVFYNVSTSPLHTHLFKRSYASEQIKYKASVITWNSLKRKYFLKNVLAANSTHSVTLSHSNFIRFRRILLHKYSQYTNLKFEIISDINKKSQ